jgi:hypothetical protein
LGELEWRPIIKLAVCSPIHHPILWLRCLAAIWKSEKWWLTPSSYLTDQLISWGKKATKENLWTRTLKPSGQCWCKLKHMLASI